MTNDQRIQLVGLIHQFGGAMSAGDMDSVGRAIDAIKRLLDELTDTEPRVVEFGGMRVEV